MSSSILETVQLTHHFSSTQPVLQDVALQVPEGAIYGFLGPNGAGKTTTLRLVLGLLALQKGSIRVLGNDLATHRLAILRQVGSLIEQPSLYGHLSATENLEVYRRIYNVDQARIKAVLHLVGLSQTGTKKAKQFSLGMKQRLSIAIALLHGPRLLILDEPTNGLDPNGIIETRSLLQQLNRDAGITVVVSSHILAEVEKMATHIGIIHGGRLLFQGTLPQLQALKQKQTFIQLTTGNNASAFELLRPFAAEQAEGHLLLPFRSDKETAAINKLLVQHGIDVYQLQPRSTDLEQLFMDLTSQGI